MSGTESERNELAREQYEQQLEVRPAITRLEPTGDADHDRQNAEMFGLPEEPSEAEIESNRIARGEEKAEKKPAKKTAKKD